MKQNDNETKWQSIVTSPMTMTRYEKEIMTSPMTMDQNDNETK